MNVFGVAPPMEMLYFSLSLSDPANGGVEFPSGTGLISDALSALGPVEDALDVVTRLAPAKVSLPSKFDFDFTVTRDKDNPLVFRVKGIYPAKPKYGGTVWWAAGNTAAKASYKFHKDKNCPYLQYTSGYSYNNSGTLKEAMADGVFGGFCSHCAADEAAKTDKDFENEKKTYNAIKNGGSSGGSSINTQITAFFEAEVGYNVNTGSYSMAFTELGMAFMFKYDYEYIQVIPIPNPLIPGLAVTVEFATGLGVELKARVLPNKVVTGIDSVQNNMDWLVLEAKTTGYMRLRGAIGIDLWVLAANVGVFGQADLTAEFLSNCAISPRRSSRWTVR